MKKLTLLLCILCAMAASVLSASVTVKNTAKGVMLENDYVKLEIIRQGGKIASLVNKNPISTCWLATKAFMPVWAKFAKLWGSRWA
jgi:hypothetical protein